LLDDWLYLIWFCCFLCLRICFTSQFMTFSISYQIPIIFLIFIFLDKPFFVYYCKSRVTLYYFVVLLKQTSEVKTLTFTMSHNFKTVVQLYLRQSVAGLSPQRSVFGHRSFHLAFAIQKLALLHGFLPVFSYFCQHHYTSATYWHYDHRRRYIISCFCSVLNRNFSLCLCYQFQWRAPSARGASVYPECSGLVSEFEHLYVVTWWDRKLVHNYTVLNCQWIYPSSLW